jgi:hypothetical protein
MGAVKVTHPDGLLVKTVARSTERVRAVRIHGTALVLASGLMATPAHACVEVLDAQSDARALRDADVVLEARALTESYIRVPGAGSLRAGVATAQVVAVLKGRGVKAGEVVTYRVLDGEGEAFVQRPTRMASCPARRFTRPGKTYRLFLKLASDGGPPIIIYPTDAYSGRLSVKTR